MQGLDIKMVDLVGQTRKIRSEIDAAIGNVIDAANYIKGGQVADFERQLGEALTSRHVVACGNGTDALQIALMGLGLESGDEVIVPSFTYVASAEVIALLGLKPVFVEVNPQTFNIDPEEVKQAITPRTRAIIPVHLFGQGADMEVIMAIAEAHGLPVIEDTAQAVACSLSVGGDQRVAGTIGTIGTLSFFPSKNLGCFGDGGAILIQDDELATRIRKLANHGQKAKYHFEYVGCNSRLDTLQAAVLGVKLKHLSDYIAQRKKAAAYYDEHLGMLEELEVPFRDATNTDHVFHQYTVKVPAEVRSELTAYLKERGIPTQIYYPVPVHLNEAYQFLGHKAGDFPITEALSQSVFSLPMHTELTTAQLNHITTTIREFFK